MDHPDGDSLHVSGPPRDSPDGAVPTVSQRAGVQGGAVQHCIPISDSVQHIPHVIVNKK